MDNYKEIDGNLITLALDGEFDVVTHGCNCFCTMGAGIAPQMAKAFGADDFRMEGIKFKGSMNKLGTIDYETGYLQEGRFGRHTKGSPNPKIDFTALSVVNSYSQYDFRSRGGKSPIDYEALTLCMRKINFTFKGKHIGLPQIGAGLAGGDWNRIKGIIQDELTDMEVTVVIFVP